MHSPLITLSNPEFEGGIGRTFANLANEFISLGYRVHIVADNCDSSYFNSLRKEVDIFHLKTSHALGGLPHFGAYLLRNKPDAVVTSVVRHTVLALRSKRMTGSSARIYASIHSTYSKAFELLSEEKRSRRLKLLKKYYPLSDAIVAVSDGVSRDFGNLTGISPDKIVVIHNPIMVDEITVLAREDVDHPWFRKGSPPVLLGAGRLAPAKDFHLLIEAFEIVRSKTTCRLVILGEGDLREALEVRAASSPYRHDISLPGTRSNPYSYMSKAAVFVLSSLWEGFACALAEAMATGTPVVSTDCPHGPDEILANGKYGPLVPPGSAEQLAAGIMDQLLDPTPPDLLIEGSQRFSARTIAARYLELFGLLRPGHDALTGIGSPPPGTDE